MVDKARDAVPTRSSLLAFESAVRHGNFSWAAKELGVSQPALSRQIANLEQQLSTQLFRRSREGVVLTDAGMRFRDGVVPGLSLIRAASLDAIAPPLAEQVVITCSHDLSHLYLLPRYGALQEVLGEHVAIRILTFQYDTQQLSPNPIADIALTWEARAASVDHVVVHGEAMSAVCSPHYAAAHAETLKLPVSLWGGLTFLDLLRPNMGWASWDDWFGVAGCPETAPQFRGFDSYTYVLEAATAGHGIALGWQNYVDRYLEAGMLVPLTDVCIEFDNRCRGMLTARGQTRLIAHDCLAFFDDIAAK